LHTKFDKDALELACKEIIETILFCLPNAYKGTVYRIGKPAELVAKRVASGIIQQQGEAISWGLPAVSDYNPPGKTWLEYRDEPSRPLEAMGWCVERQKSWTAENPETDIRSVRAQVYGMAEDFHHMEPVLIRKEDLRIGNGKHVEYPVTYQGKTIWQDSEYETAAVIKIHFRPSTIKIGSLETKIIKKLSRTLGTELLSKQLKEQSLEAMRQLAEDKLNSCNLLADSLRNAITKSGLIFSLIKLELGFLRRQWEDALLKGSDKKRIRGKTVQALNKALGKMDGITDEEREVLMGVQNRFLELSLPPERGERWVSMQIEDKWNKVLHKMPTNDGRATKGIRRGIDNLKQSLYLGKDPDILSAYDKIPESLKEEWIDLIYKDKDQIDFEYINRLIRILEDPSLNLPFQEKSRKSFIRLKALAEIMGRLEENTNVVLRQVLNGNDEKAISSVLDRKPLSSLPRRMNMNV
jgi:hypothetical protein